MADTQARSGLAERLWQRRRSGLPIAGAGLALTAGAALAAAYAGVPQAVALPHWWGPWPHRQPGQLTGWVTAGIVLLGALCVLWTWVVLPLLIPTRFGRTLRLRTLAVLAAVWSVPLLVSGPMGSLDVQSYAAVGRLAASGLDPYQVSPSWLDDAYGAAVDPLWRWTPTPYGPVQVGLFHLAALVAGHHVGVAVVVLRGMAVLGVIAAVALGLRAAPPTARVAVFAVAALNPVVLVHVVSGAHFDVLVGALAVLVVLSSRARRPGLAMAVAVIACALKLPGVVLVGFVLLDVLRRTPAPERARTLFRTVACGLGVAAVIVVAFPDPFGWVPALRVPGIVRNGSAPSTWASYVLGAFTGHLSGQSLDHSFTIGRTFVALVGAVVVAALLWRSTSGSRGAAFHGVGWALIALALSGPSLYPWYLTWGLFAAAAGSGPRGRLALVGLGSVTCLFSAMSPGALPVVAWVATTAGVVLFTVWAARLFTRHRASDRPRPTPVLEPAAEPEPAHATSLPGIAA